MIRFRQLGIGVVATVAMSAWLALVGGTPAARASTCPGAYFGLGEISPTNSHLHLYYLRSDCVKTGDNYWRAGSGSNTNECAKGTGWLPNGWYDFWSPGHVNNYGGTSVQGRVWRLSDKVCSDGSTVRTELFIHTKETSGQGQACPDFCWAGDSSYYSNGCIKLSRSPYADDMGAVHSNWASWDGRHSFSATKMLYVYR
jgi:hypothetical protein